MQQFEQARLRLGRLLSGEKSFPQSLPVTRRPKVIRAPSIYGRFAQCVPCLLPPSYQSETPGPCLGFGWNSSSVVAVRLRRTPGTVQRETAEEPCGPSAVPLNDAWAGSGLRSAL